MSPHMGHDGGRVDTVGKMMKSGISPHLCGLRRARSAD